MQIRLSQILSLACRDARKYSKTQANKRHHPSVGMCAAFGENVANKHKQTSLQYDFLFNLIHHFVLWQVKCNEARGFVFFLKPPSYYVCLTNALVSDQHILLSCNVTPAIKNRGSHHNVLDFQIEIRAS